MLTGLSENGRQILRVLHELAVQGREVVLLSLDEATVVHPKKANNVRFGTIPLGQLAAELLPQDFDEKDAKRLEPVERGSVDFAEGPHAVHQADLRDLSRHGAQGKSRAMRPCRDRARDRLLGDRAHVPQRERGGQAL